MPKTILIIIFYFDTSTVICILKNDYNEYGQNLQLVQFFSCNYVNLYLNNVQLGLAAILSNNASIPHYNCVTVALSCKFNKKPPSRLNSLSELTYFKYNFCGYEYTLMTNMNTPTFIQFTVKTVYKVILCKS